MNGVPLRRVNQAYVIATSTKVDVSSLGSDMGAFDDAYFAREKSKSSKKPGEEFFEEKAEVRAHTASPCARLSAWPGGAARRCATTLTATPRVV